MNRIGCLIIHGFAGDIEEIEPLNHFLSEQGFVTRCPLLNGHGYRKRDLEGTTYIDWITCAEEAYLSLKEQCEKVVVIGFSMGGLIAINLAVKYPVTGLVLLNAPIHHWDIKRIIINIVEDITSRTYENVKYYRKSMFAISFRALLSFKKFLHKTRPLFSKVDCPVFIAQGLLDDTVHHKSAEVIFDNVRSTTKFIHYYKKSNHQICKGKDKDALFEDVLAYLKLLEMGEK